MTATELIQHLHLRPHPEGGYYKEVYRSELMVHAGCLPPAFGGDRHCATSIYYLLQKDDFSAFHRIRSDELWHFHAGGNLLLHLINPAGDYQRFMLGSIIDSGARFQVVMPAGVWFAAEPAEGTTYTLAGCTVSPGFNFRDFELAEKEKLASEFPAHKNIIHRLCR